MKTGSGNKGLDWVIIFGMIAAYPKTADLLSTFSPEILDNIFGMPMALMYGLFCAAMVEGTILFLHFDRRAHVVASAQIVKWVLILVSFLCQIFDGFVTTDSVNQMSPTLRILLTYGIPALPLIIAVLVASIGALPDDATPRPMVGLKHRLPSFKRMWEGDPVENTEFSPAEVVETNIKGKLPASPNGEEADTVNPTKAGRR